ncbi:MAG: response regulator transcription factor [Clostridia bacterium]|nr:response regulator transcription factor [Clostridia bacterium]MBQ2948096.1 response regulator transcription factor [Clostridia bacterium]MBQ4609592.1 response regulator transcription factor [Clostridia bacterium]MBQ6858986.1 response regulator transcription factor [Clostridia bacterium]MBQ7051614.1 response regulator transcription factor [Clostridia bacterium]
MRLLIAEDDRLTADTLAKRLREEHYAVDVCYSGTDAWDYLRGAEYDVCVLDIMMPGIDGLTLVGRMRGAGMQAPVLLLTARDAVSDRVQGLNAGADDYLVKPFAYDELSARLRVLTRRTRQTTNCFTLADLTVDADRRSVLRAGEAIALTSREYALLEYMIRNKGHVLTRGQILEHVWSYDYEGASNMIDVYIRSLRRKIDEGHAVKLIHTVRYAGYVLREGT